MLTVNKLLPQARGLSAVLIEPAVKFLTERGHTVQLGHELRSFTTGDGKAGALTVTTPRGEVVLDRAYAGADVYAQGRVERSEEDAAAVRKRFSAALGARPPQR